MKQCKRALSSPSPLGFSLFCIKTFAFLRTGVLHLASTSSPTVWFISGCSSVEKWADVRRRLVRANSWTCRVFVCACSVFAVGAPVIREEADFGLPSGEDSLQAGFLRRLAHVLHHPVQQLRDRRGGKENTQWGSWLGSRLLRWYHIFFLLPSVLISIYIVRHVQISTTDIYQHNITNTAISPKTQQLLLQNLDG